MEGNRFMKKYAFLFGLLALSTASHFVFADELPETIEASETTDTTSGINLAYHQWVGGDCFEHVVNSQQIDEVSKNHCRKSEGSYFVWSKGKCQEYTKKGELIGEVWKSRCRKF
jgi:hypothetical protein